MLPGVLALGLGLSLTVAPLTATALGSVGERHAGIASGVNSAMARAADLLAVAVLPLAAGLRAGTLTDSATLAPAYRTAMLLYACLWLAAAVTVFIAIPSRAAGPQQPAEADTAPSAASRASTLRMHCAVAGPPLHPRPRSLEPRLGR